MKLKSGGVVIFAFILALFSLFSSPQGVAQVVKWRVQSFYPGGALYDTLVSKYFADTVKKLSGGRLEVMTYGSGSLVPFAETLDAVGKGVIEGAIWWPAYDTGRDMTGTIFGADIPFGFNGEEWFAWFTQYGGLELMEELYGKWNIKPIGPLVGGPTQIFLQLKKPARSLKDLKGRVIRIVGIEAEVMKEFGVKPISLPAGEIYTAMERGTIDGLEYASPIDNFKFGFHEVAKHILLPGWHSTTATAFLMVNKDVWAKLPDDLKFVVESAAYKTFLAQRAYEIPESAKAMRKLKEAGCTITRLSDADLQALDEAGKKVLDRYASQNPFFAKVLKSIMEYKALLKELEPLTNVSYKVQEPKK